MTEFCPCQLCKIINTQLSIPLKDCVGNPHVSNSFFTKPSKSGMTSKTPDFSDGLPERTIAILGNRNSDNLTIFHALVGQLVLPPNYGGLSPILVRHAAGQVDGQQKVMIHNNTTINVGDKYHNIFQANISCPSFEFVTVWLYIKNPLMQAYSFLYLPPSYARKYNMQIGECLLAQDSYFAGIQCIHLSEIPDNLSCQKIGHRFEHPERSMTVITFPDAEDKRFDPSLLDCLSAKSGSHHFFYNRPPRDEFDRLITILDFLWVEGENDIIE